MLVGSGNVHERFSGFACLRFSTATGSPMLRQRKKQPPLRAGHFPMFSLRNSVAQQRCRIHNTQRRPTKQQPASILPAQRAMSAAALQSGARSHRRAAASAAQAATPGQGADVRGLKGKVVIVTGGGGGIGNAVCKRFAEEGSIVAVFDLNPESAASTAGAIRAAGGQATDYMVDIADQARVVVAVAEVERDFGPVDVLVNNAGWDHAANFLDTDKELWERLVAINLYGALHMHHAVLKGMSQRGRGRVINIASDAGRVGSSGESVYSFCKGGLIAFSKTLARELAKKQINVNVVCPGPTDTALFKDFCGAGEYGDKLRSALTRSIPFGRLGQPGDLPGAICFLASDDAAFITGQVLSVSGGLTMAG
jgi:2-hydroxycyclohexanecarboxyl-CoA dehydrogenase